MAGHEHPAGVAVLVVDDVVDHRNDPGSIAAAAVRQHGARMDVPATVAAHGGRADQQEAVLVGLRGERTPLRTNVRPLAVTGVDTNQDRRMRNDVARRVEVHADSCRVVPERGDLLHGRS